MHKLQGIEFILFFSLLACGADQTELEKESRHQADSLFNLRRPQLELELDSICQMKLKNAMETQLDSIIEVRKSEIIKLQEGL